jgi:hypothetical protein
LTTLTATQVAQSLVGPGVAISNVEADGGAGARERAGRAAVAGEDDMTGVQPITVNTINNGNPDDDPTATNPHL